MDGGVHCVQQAAIVIIDSFHFVSVGNRERDSERGAVAFCMAALRVSKSPCVTPVSAAHHRSQGNSHTAKSHLIQTA